MHVKLSTIINSLRNIFACLKLDGILQAFAKLKKKKKIIFRMKQGHKVV